MATLFDEERNIWISSQKQRPLLRDLPGISVTHRGTAADGDMWHPLEDFVPLTRELLAPCVKACQAILEQSNGLVIYCTAGRNRSAAVLCLLAMTLNGTSFKTEYDKLKRLRFRRVGIHKGTQAHLA